MEMNEEYCTLNDLKPGESASVVKLCAKGSMHRRMLDIGLFENALVECVGISPLGDPRAFLICGAVIALRCEDCENVIVVPSKNGS